MSTEADILTAAKTAANVALSPRMAYTPGEVKRLSSKPTQYAEVNVVQRPKLTAGRLTPGPDLSWWRLTVRAVADTDTNARTILADVRTALEFQRLTVGSAQTTPIAYETGDAVNEDDDWWSGLAVYTFTL